LFSESAEAAAEIVDAVIPHADEVTKDAVAEAAAEKAEEITDAVDNAVEAHTGEPLTESEYSEVVFTVAQDIYTNVLADLASMQSMYAMESLFADEDVYDQNLYARISAKDKAEEEMRVLKNERRRATEAMNAARKTYQHKWGTGFGMTHEGVGRAIGHLKTAGVGAAGGALVGGGIAAARGASIRKGALIGALVGGAGGYAASKLGHGFKSDYTKAYAAKEAAGHALDAKMNAFLDEHRKGYAGLGTKDKTRARVSAIGQL
jgi:hypothetical protein